MTLLTTLLLMCMTSPPEAAEAAAEPGDAVANAEMASPPEHDPEADAAALEELVEQATALLEPPTADDATLTLEQEQKLYRIAYKAAELSGRFEAADKQFTASMLEVRCYHHIARFAADDGRQPAVSPIDLLRYSALRVRSTEKTPSAPAIGAFWILQSELLEAAKQTHRFAQQQASARAMDTFLDKRRTGGEPTAKRIRASVAMALLRVYDEVGESRKLLSLLDDVAAKLSASEREALQRRYACHRQVGATLNAKLTLADGKTWDAEQQRGRPMLIEFRNSDMPSRVGKSLAPSALAEEGDGESLRLAGGGHTLSVLVDGKVGAAEPTDAPLFIEQDDGPRLSALFELSVLPRYVLIDETGKVLAIGATPDITRHLAGAATTD